MGNQQGKAEDTDLAWLAGFIDGEGAFMMLILPGKRLREMGRAYVVPRICVVNTDGPTLETVVTVLRGAELPFHVSGRKGGVNPIGRQWADSWDVRVQGIKRCRQWCDRLIPYLRTKRDQAQAMLEFCDLRLSVSDQHKRPYSEREITIVNQLRKRPQNPHRLHAQPV